MRVTRDKMREREKPRQTNRENERIERERERERERREGGREGGRVIYWGVAGTRSSYPTGVSLTGCWGNFGFIPVALDPSGGHGGVEARGQDPS